MFGAAVIVRPLRIAVAPLGISTWLGYQRPSTMSARRVQVSLNGSNVITRGAPFSVERSVCPPVTSA